MPVPKRVSDALTRLQIEVTPERMEEFDRLMLKCGVATKKELFNSAMSLLMWAVEEVEAGHEVASFNRAEKSYDILRMPVLDQAKLGRDPLLRIERTQQVPVSLVS